MRFKGYPIKVDDDVVTSNEAANYSRPNGIDNCPKVHDREDSHATEFKTPKIGG
jgi:hypothetical protein